jgi:outer membrane protein OmpA-like peptidoglycan-associated protein
MSLFKQTIMFYDLEEIKKRDARKKRESDDYLQVGDDKYVRFGNRFFVVGGDDLPIGGGMPTIGGTIPPTPIETSEEIPINLDIARPFVFDSTELTDEAKPIFEKFIKDVSEKYKGVTANVDVITSSSVDGDPSETLNSGITRGQYDMNLSQRRAQAIADILNNRVGISTLKFIPRGIGQTTQFGPGWTREKPTTPKETEPNRRLIINLPRLTKKIPK